MLVDVLERAGGLVIPSQRALDWLAERLPLVLSDKPVARVLECLLRTRRGLTP